MNDKKVRQCLTGMPEAVVDYPFGPDVEVYKVGGKMFGLYSVGEQRIGQINLKCDPNEALMLRDIFNAVIPGYHMNKKHWNTVILDGSLPDKEITRMIDNSYLLVVNGMPLGERRGLTLRNAEEKIFLREQIPQVK